MSLTGKTALVTGAGAGIGRAIALRLAREKAKVGVNDVDRLNAMEVCSLIKDGGTDALPLIADVSDEAQVDGMFADLIGRWGRIDVLVANAAICPAGPVVEQDLVSWERAFEINVRGVFLCARAAARQMIRQRGGRILISSSGAGLAGIRFLACYSATKAALIAFAQALSRELGPYGICVNAYSPGYTPDTQMQKGLAGRLERFAGAGKGAVEEAYVSRKIPLGRVARPEDTANLVAFLCSDEADYITGQMILCDGGIGAVAEMT